MRMNRKKPWRKIRIKSTYSPYFRKICFSILVLEAAFFVGELDMSGLFYMRYGEEIMSEPDVGTENGQNNRAIYGLKFRFHDGILDIYWKEEVKNVN